MPDNSTAINAEFEYDEIPINVIDDNVSYVYNFMTTSYKAQNYKSLLKGKTYCFWMSNVNKANNAEVLLIKQYGKSGNTAVATIKAYVKCKRK